MDSSNNYNSMYEFINSYDNLDKNIEKYKMTKKDHNNYILLKYNSVNVNEYNKEDIEKYNNLLRSFRGLIVNKNENKIVCYGLDGKINNYDNFKLNNNFNDIIIEESIDGTLINLYYDEQWNISTKSCYDAKKSYWYSRYSFNELFLDAWKNYYDDFEELNKECTYSFVLMHPNNQIVTYYQKPELRLLQIRNMKDFSFVENSLKIESPKKLDLICNNYEELNKIVHSYSYELEGLMLYSKDKKQRFKLQNNKYLNVKNIKGNYRKVIYRIIDLYNNDQDKLNELLEYFPHYNNNLNKFLYIKKRFIGSLFYLYNKTKKQYKYVQYPNHISKYVYMLHNKYIENVKNNVKRSINKKDCMDLFDSLDINEQINVVNKHNNYINTTEY